MALKDRDLIKPSIYAVIVGLVKSIIGIIPLIGAALVFAHYVSRYVFSGMTVYLIYGYLAEGDGRMDKAWTKVRGEFWNIVSLAEATTAVNVFTSQLRRGGGRPAGANMLGGASAGAPYPAGNNDRGCQFG